MGLRVAIVAVLLLGPSVWAQGAPREIEAGKETYDLQCLQCHGEDGDAVSHVDIVPVAGIRRRYPREVIASLSGAFSGRVLAGKDRQYVVEYLRTLRGVKGFADPGWLITPHTVERKAPRVTEFRILDTRPEEAYAAGHVTNAVRVEPVDCASSPTETTAWLSALGVTPTTVVIVYDEAGGPSAACVWWRVRRAGHEYVSVLDGGWRRFSAERRFASRVVPKFDSAAYPHPQPAQPGPPVDVLLNLEGWDWQQAVGSTGFRSSPELARLVEKSGLRGAGSYRLRAPLDQVAHLILTLHLLGYTAEYDTARSTLTVSAALAD